MGKIGDVWRKVRSSKTSILISISFALFTDMVCYGIILPFLPSIIENKYHGTQVTTGLLFAMFSAGCLVGTPIVAIASDRIGRRTPFILGMSLLALSTVLFSYGHYLGLLFIARFVQGLSSAVSWVVGLALIADIYPNHEFGTISGLVIGGNTVGALCGPIIGGAVFDKFGYHAPFWVCIAFVVLDMLCRVLLVDENNIKNLKRLKESRDGDVMNLIKNNQLSLQDGANYIGLDVLDKHRERESNGYDRFEHIQNQSVLHSEEVFNMEVEHPIVVKNGENLDDTINEQLHEQHDAPVISNEYSVDNSDIIINEETEEMASGVDTTSQVEERGEGGAILAPTSIDLDDRNGANEVFDEVQFKDEPASKPDLVMNEREFYKMALKRVDVWVTLTSIIIFGIGVSALDPILSLILEKDYKRTDAVAVSSYLFSSFTAPFFILSPIAGYLTDHNYVTRTKMSFIGAVLAAAAFPLFTNDLRPFGLLFLVFPMIGGGLAVFFNPIIPILTYIVEPQETGLHNAKILSLFCVVYSIGILIGPVYSTIVKSHSLLSFTVSYSVLLILNGFGLLYFFYNKPTSKFQSMKITFTN